MTFDDVGPKNPYLKDVTSLCRSASSAYRHVVVQEGAHRTYFQWLDWDGCDTPYYASERCRKYHLHYPQLIRNPTVLIVALFRHPVSRFESSYNMAMSTPDDGHCGFLHCPPAWSRRMALRNVTIDDVAHAYGQFDGSHNLQTRYLGDDWAYDHSTPQWILGRSAGPWTNIYRHDGRNLERVFERSARRLHQLDVCGTIDNADAFLYAIMQRLGIENSEFLQCRTTYTSSHPEKLQTPLYEYVLAHDLWDMALYDMASRHCKLPPVISKPRSAPTCTADGFVCARLYAMTPSV